ncbi:MAG: undecaprenyl-diphosphatase UppP [Anaerolineae bacterium]|nr:undecaprenyl-diphosphatase UppP [Anaerolineae bacterium]
MSLWQAILMGILQGATEFLPVSSSGHLVLVPWLLNLPTNGLAFDAVVHWGTAFAVVAYFWRDWLRLLQGGWRALRARSLEDPEGRLLLLILLANIPVGVVGLLFEDFFEEVFATPPLAALFLLVTAALLIVAERLGDPARDLGSVTWRDALLIGVAQMVAIFPGISRSGATIAAGLGRGLKRDAAARFSFLLVTPILFAAGLKQVLDLAGTGELAAEAGTLVAGFLAAAAVGYAAIWWLMGFLRRQRLYVFAGYCAAFGVFCLMVALARG